MNIVLEALEEETEEIGETEEIEDLLEEELMIDIKDLKKDLDIIAEVDQEMMMKEENLIGIDQLNSITEGNLKMIEKTEDIGIGKIEVEADQIEVIEEIAEAEVIAGKEEAEIIVEVEDMKMIKEEEAMNIRKMKKT